MSGVDERVEKVRYMIARLGNQSYDGGVNGTCYECPFASAPLDSADRVADWRDIGHDPTEAYFRCSLPGRDNEKPEWGEYAPCTEDEWATHLRTLVDAIAAAVAGLEQRAEEAGRWPIETLDESALRTIQAQAARVTALETAIRDFFASEGGETPEWYVAVNERTKGENYPSKAALARTLAAAPAAPERAADG